MNLNILRLTLLCFHFGTIMLVLLQLRRLKTVGGYTPSSQTWVRNRIFSLASHPGKDNTNAKIKIIVVVVCIKVVDTKQMHLSGPFVFKWPELENYYPFLPFDYVTSGKVDMLETIPQNLGSMVMN